MTDWYLVNLDFRQNVPSNYIELTEGKALADRRKENSNYHPPTKLREGNVFERVCPPVSGTVHGGIPLYRTLPPPPSLLCKALDPTHPRGGSTYIPTGMLSCFDGPFDESSKRWACKKNFEGWACKKILGKEWQKMVEVELGL